MEYDRAARKRLGRVIRAARVKAGYTNRADFADRMKRSTRQVQALENGEDGVGPDTWAAAATALGWTVDYLYAILDGRTADQAHSTELTTVSDEELVAEVLRRMRKTGDSGGDTAATKDPGSGPDAPPTLSLAARRTGRDPRGGRENRDS